MRAQRALRRAGVTAELHVYEAQSHAAYFVVHPSPEAEAEAEDVLREIAAFFERQLGTE